MLLNARRNANNTIAESEKRKGKKPEGAKGEGKGKRTMSKRNKKQNRKQHNRKQAAAKKQNRRQQKQTKKSAKIVNVAKLVRILKGIEEGDAVAFGGENGMLTGVPFAGFVRELPSAIEDDDVENARSFGLTVAASLLKGKSLIENGEGIAVEMNFGNAGGGRARVHAVMFDGALDEPTDDEIDKAICAIENGISDGVRTVVMSVGKKERKTLEAIAEKMLETTETWTETSDDGTMKTDKYRMEIKDQNEKTAEAGSQQGITEKIQALEKGGSVVIFKDEAQNALHAEAQSAAVASWLAQFLNTEADDADVVKRVAAINYAQLDTILEYSKRCKEPWKVKASYIGDAQGENLFVILPEMEIPAGVAEKLVAITAAALYGSDKRAVEIYRIDQADIKLLEGISGALQKIREDKEIGNVWVMAADEAANSSDDEKAKAAA